MIDPVIEFTRWAKHPYKRAVRELGFNEGIHQSFFLLHCHNFHHSGKCRYLCTSFLADVLYVLYELYIYVPKDTLINRDPGTLFGEHETESLECRGETHSTI